MPRKHCPSSIGSSCSLPKWRRGPSLRIFGRCKNLIPPYFLFPKRGTYGLSHRLAAITLLWMSSLFQSPDGARFCCGCWVPPPQSPVALINFFLTLNTPLSSPDGDNFQCGRKSPPSPGSESFVVNVSPLSHCPMAWPRVPPSHRPAGMILLWTLSPTIPIARRR